MKKKKKWGKKKMQSHPKCEWIVRERKTKKEERGTENKGTRNKKQEKTKLENEKKKKLDSMN